MADVRQYTVRIADSEIERLRSKLSLASFPDELEGAEWDYGAPLSDVKRLSTYWKDRFDWKKAEYNINELPNRMVTIDIDGFDPLEIHFIHAAGANKAAIPLLFVHGCMCRLFKLRDKANSAYQGPGSFLEVSKLLPLLKQSEQEGGPSFHVVAPSLPNFGFSSRVKERGFGLGQYAETCHKLMLTLGYDEYVTQGGDWVSNCFTCLTFLGNLADIYK